MVHLTEAGQGGAQVSIVCNQCSTSIALLTEKCSSYNDMNMKLHSDLDQKNEQFEEQRKTLKQDIKPQVEKMNIGVQFNFLVPMSGNL